MLTLLLEANALQRENIPPELAFWGLDIEPSINDAYLVWRAFKPNAHQQFNYEK